MFGSRVGFRNGLAGLVRTAGRNSRWAWLGTVSSRVGSGSSFGSVFLRWRESKSWSLNAEGGPLFGNVTQPVTLLCPRTGAVALAICPDSPPARCPHWAVLSTCTSNCEPTGDCRLFSTIKTSPMEIKYIQFLLRSWVCPFYFFPFDCLVLALDLVDSWTRSVVSGTILCGRVPTVQRIARAIVPPGVSSAFPANSSTPT